MAPLAGSPRWLQWSLCVGSIALTLALTARLAYLPFAWAIPDGNAYVAIARGDMAQVMQPFASRQLGAMLAAATARLLHSTVEQAFFLQATVSVAFTLAIIAAIAVKTQSPRWLLLAMAIVPFWSPQIQYFVLPDALYSAELAVLMVLLLLDRLGAAALMMFPLMLTRESTSLTLVCLLIAAWKPMRWRDRIVAVASAALGSWAVSRLAVGSLSNQEHLPQSIYMLMKVPWNLLRNVLGLQPWSNVNTELCTVPRWSLPLHLGSIHAVGICGVSFSPLYTWMTAVVYNFGLLPVLLGYLWWQRRPRSSRCVLLRFALLYGTISFVLTPMLGTWMIHLSSYAWPLFFVALPLLFDELPLPATHGSRAWAGLGFFALHIVACRVATGFIESWYLPVQMVLWMLALWLVHLWLRPRWLAATPKSA